MSASAGRPKFPERSGYQRRRLADAAFLLPILGALLFAAPIMWPTPELSAISMSGAILYFFGSWFLLIFCAWLIGRQLRGWSATEGAETEGSGQM